MGVVKLAEAANITAMMKGSGSKPSSIARAMTIGPISTATALFEIISVRALVST